MNEKEVIYVRPYLPKWVKITYAIILTPFILMALGFLVMGVIMAVAL